MNLLPSLKRRLSKQPTESKQSIEPKNLSRSKQPVLCERCESLDIMQPWTKGRASPTALLLIAVIKEDSIDKSCALCMEFEVFLRPPIMPDRMVYRRSVYLRCHYTAQEDDQYTTQFSVNCGYPPQLWHLVPINPMVPQSLNLKHMPLKFWRRRPSGSRVGSSSDPFLHSCSIDYSRLKKWIGWCHHYHGDTCGTRQAAGFRPTRFIDCKQKRFCTTDEAYVCLSYVWGMGPPSTGELDGAFPEDLPQTIADAMAVTLGIGFRYLWVDRYCIDQSDAEEKHTIIQNMNAIYEGAELTIIAATGSDPYYGLPGVADQRHPTPSLTIGDHTFIALRDPQEEVRLSRWNARGWTYQEALLSRRRLVFTDTQIYLQCLSDHFLEGQDEGQAMRGTFLTPVFPGSGIGYSETEVYYRLAEYFFKDLSYETDIIDAFLGIFQAFAKKAAEHASQPMSHFYGIPIIIGDKNLQIIDSTRDIWNDIPIYFGNLSFALGLAWTMGNGLPENDSSSQPVAQNNAFPSWSWASYKLCRENFVDGSRHLGFKCDRQIMGPLDGTVQIRFHPRCGAKTDLVDYVQYQQYYTDFHPVVEITTYVVIGSILEGSKFSALPWSRIWGHQEPVLNQLTAVFVGTTGVLTDYQLLIFILVQDDGSGHYRRVAVLEQEIDPESRERWYENPNCNHTTFLQDLANGPEWHQQTLLLV